MIKKHTQQNVVNRFWRVREQQLLTQTNKQRNKQTQTDTNTNTYTNTHTAATDSEQKSSALRLSTAPRSQHRPARRLRANRRALGRAPCLQGALVDESHKIASTVSLRPVPYSCPRNMLERKQPCTLKRCMISCFHESDKAMGSSRPQQGEATRLLEFAKHAASQLSADK